MDRVLITVVARRVGVMDASIRPGHIIEMLLLD